MRFRVDHDLHIHSLISPCSGHDPRQSPEAILAYGIANDYRLLCVPDHAEDEKVSCAGRRLWLAEGVTLKKARSILPLPQSPRCRFLFGLEVDMALDGQLVVSREELDRLDFVIFAPSHQHLTGYTVPEDYDPSPEAQKTRYMQRMDCLLSMDLPVGKTGLAHPTTRLACRQDPVAMFDLISDREYEALWTRVREKGMGVEINPEGHTREAWEHILRPYRIAKAMGCKFYLGGDAHTPEGMWGRKRSLRRFVELLKLQEEDKLPFVLENMAPETQD